MIYNKLPILVLWDLVKPIKNVPKYKEIMDEDEDSIPNNYILLRSNISNTSKNYGDGKTIIRQSSCDIILVSKGTASNTTDKHNIILGEIRSTLELQDVNYQETNLGYDDENDNTTTTLSLMIDYI